LGSSERGLFSHIEGDDREADMICEAKGNCKMKEQAAEETYEDVRMMVYQMSWRCHHQTGIDWDECVSAGNLAFARAYRRWRPDGGSKFSTYCCAAIQNTLLKLRSDKRSQSREETGLELELRSAVKGLSGISHILDELGEDARTIVKLIAESPAGLTRLATVRDDKLPGGESKRKKCRRILWQHLRGLGWSMARTLDCFCEIEEVLIG
jgi:DNA-directed RNA polymerase specialized sigma24 family protein